MGWGSGQRRRKRRRKRTKAERRRRKIILIVSGVLSAIAVGGGSVASGLLVRYKRRFARGADWLARSEAWWSRRRHAWIATVSRRSLRRTDGSHSEDEPLSGTGGSHSEDEPPE